jgi:cytochrome c-type biogenesis protein
MPLILLSFLAGVLTILAPCVLPLLPIIVGSSAGSKDKLKPYLVTAGLVVSITLFTVLLKASTLLINIDPSFWKILSGGILIVFGLIYLFPDIWDSFSTRFGLSKNSDKILENATEKEGWLGSLLTGGSLGPVFASCSPTYSLIIATVLPVNFWEGLLYIIIYSLGLATVMLAISLLGRKLVNKLNILANPNGWFKKSLGVIFILVGIAVVTGLDKEFETNLIANGSVDWLIDFENNLLKK